ncbi:MAG: tetratricopeptide repeat protein [Elusimicrobia bacterium]|nr:tetratricopeptide repeat protein [Elusimicrobiota bacterium]
MRRVLLLAALLAPRPSAAASTSAAGGAESQAARSAELAKHYDAALQLYTKGEYSQAILEWGEVLKKAPDQSSASNMITLARQAIDKRDHEKQAQVFKYASEGRYQDSMVALQPLLETDPTNPLYTLLQSRLDRVSFVVPAVSTDSKAWRTAVRGLTGYIARQDDLQLAYDGLRRAEELDPKERLFPRLIAVLLSDDPALAQDAVTPGMGVLEYKRFVALNMIYDGKYADAIRVLQRVVRLDPEDAVALQRLGSAYFALKQKDKARELWSRASALRPDDEQLKVFLTRVGGPLPASPAAAPPASQKE